MFMNKNQIEISIIINSLNRFDLLKECLRSLSWISDSEFKESFSIVIYDAGSTDGTLEWLENNSEKFNIPINVIIPNKYDDTSFAAGLNKGVDYSIKNFENLKYLLFYETDNQILSSVPVKQALQELKEQNNLAACGFTVRKHNGKNAGVGSPFPTLPNFLMGKNIVHKFNFEAIPYKWEKRDSGANFSLVDVVYTSPLLVKVEAWKQSEGLDAKMFPFSDCDIDWAKRLRILGWFMGVVETKDVIHDNLETLSSWSKTRAIHFHQARLNYFKRYNPLTIYSIFPFLLMVRHLCEWLGTHILVKDPVKRKDLSNQFLNLFKTALNGYKLNR